MVQKAVVFQYSGCTPHGAAPAASTHLKKQQGPASTTHPGEPLPLFSGSLAKCVSRTGAELVYQTTCVVALVVFDCVCLYFPAYWQKQANAMQLLKRHIMVWKMTHE